MKVASVSETAVQSSENILDLVKAERPLQVVVWYASEDGQTGVMISNGTDRTKAIGALNAAAYEMWNA